MRPAALGKTAGSRINRGAVDMQAVYAIVVAVLGALVLLVLVSTPVTGTITTQHAPIFINGDSSFTPSNGVVLGSGTADDPYIIENWVIDASSAHGVRIEDTTAYFVVRNCLVENGKGDRHDGVYLDNVVNGKIENNTCSNNSYGIYLYSSSYNTLSNNACLGNGNGIWLQNSSYNAIENNTCEKNYDFGIYLDSSSNNALTNNTCESNILYGIRLDSSSNNALTNNTCKNNSLGIYLDSSSNNALTNNTCESNILYGIRLDSSSNNTLSNNTCENNRYNFGVMGWDPSHFDHEIGTSNLIDDRPIYYLKDKADMVIGPSLNPGYLALVRCDNITVENLALEKNGQGILLACTEKSRIENCILSNNSEGIFLYSSSNNTLSNNTCESNTWEGIYLDSSSNNALTNNTCESNSYYGIRLDSSSNNALTNNTCESNSFGIYLNSSASSTIFHNYLFNNAENNAYDDGTNYWDKNGEGNYWGDWQPPDHPDADDDGIVDEPRPISGGTNQDKYPLVLDHSLPPFNELPTADAGGPYSVDGGETVELDGTGSSDPDGTIVSYSWTITSDPTGEASLTETDNAISTFHAPFVESRASVTVSLIVEDDSGATDNIIAIVTIRPPPGETPYALYIGIIAIIIIVGLAYFGIRRGVVQGRSSKMPGLNKRLASGYLLL